MSIVSLFSHSLEVALESLKLTQTQFAERCGIPLSQLNKYVRGKIDAGASTLETISRQLPEKQRAEVIASWLRDALPSSSSGLVSISTSERLAEQPSLFESGELSRDLDRAVRYLIAQARRHTEISDLLIDLERALRGR